MSYQAIAACRATEGGPAGRAPVVAPRAASRNLAPEFRLAYKFHPNQDVYLSLAVEARVRVQKGEVVETTANQTITDRHFHVVSVAGDGSALLDLFIDNVKLSWSFNDHPPITYDTNSNVSPPKELQNVKDSIGKPLAQMRVTSQGKLLSLAGELQNQSEGFLDVLPERPIRIGDQWREDVKVTVQVTRNLNQKITLRRLYTLESVTGNMAKIRLTTTEVTPIQDPKIRAQLIQKTFGGTILFDTDKGMVTARELYCNRTETGVMGEGSVIASTSSLKGSLR